MSQVKHLRYLWYVLRHKWYVYLECRKLSVGFWQAFIHDWSKFLPSEWFPYVDYFFGDGNGIKRGRNDTGYYKPGESGDSAFDLAWLKHQHRNPHHWQWWILIQDEDDDKVLPITDGYRREMLADWRGAGKAQGHGDNTREWYQKNKGKMQLHPETRRWIESQLRIEEERHA